MSVNINISGIHQLNFDLDGTTTAALTSPGVTTISNRSNAITELTGDVTAGPGSGSVVATLSNTSTARSHLGLGTMATQNASSVAITGGDILASSLQCGGHGATATQGAAIMWDASGGTGETNFVNYKGGGVGGWWWTNLADGGNPTGATRQMTLDNNGTLTAAATVIGNKLTIAPGGGGSLTFQDGSVQSTAASVPSGTANKVYATPNGSTGSASLRALVPADLPVATTSALGGVQPDGTSITISGGVISATGGSGSFPKVVYSNVTQPTETGNFTYAATTLGDGVYRVSVSVTVTSATGPSGQFFCSGLVNYEDSVGDQDASLYDVEPSAPASGNLGTGSGTATFFAKSGTISIQLSAVPGGGCTGGSYVIEAIVIEQLA